MHVLSETDVFTATVQVIDDSDVIVPTVASLNVEAQALANRTRWLKNRTGVARRQALDIFTLYDTNALQSPQTIHTFSSTSYADRSLERVFDVFTASNYVTVAGDIVDVSVNMTAIITASSASVSMGQLKLRISFDLGSTWFDMAGADQRFSVENQTQPIYIPVTLEGAYVVTTGGLPVTIGVAGRIYDGTGGQTLVLGGSVSMKTRIERFNP
jgi:hypothetical protein